MSSFSRRRPPPQCPMGSSPPRPLSRRTVARASSSSKHSLPRQVAPPKSLPCSHSHAPVARAVSLSCARLSSSVARAQSRSATPFHRKVSLATNGFAIRFPEAAKRAVPPSFPDNSAGPIHGPRSHEARSFSRLPARSDEPTARVGPYSKVDLTAQFPRRQNRPQCIGRPHHEADRTRIRLPEREPKRPHCTGLPHCRPCFAFRLPGRRSHTTARCTRTTRAASLSGCPNGKAALAARVACASK